MKKLWKKIKEFLGFGIATEPQQTIAPSAPTTTKEDVIPTELMVEPIITENCIRLLFNKPMSDIPPHCITATSYDAVLETRIERELEDSFRVYYVLPSEDFKEIVLTVSGNEIVGMHDGVPLETPLTFTISLVPIVYKPLHLKVLLEGLYKDGGTMNEAKSGLDMLHWGEGIADKITVELHDATDYKKIIFSESVFLHTDGNATAQVPDTYKEAYYITIKHRNSIEVVSAVPVAFDAADGVAYDFTSDPAATFEKNIKWINGSFCALYGGDVNQDGVVDGSDMALVDNASTMAVYGYIPEDVNGDGFVDGSDMVIIDNNTAAAIQKRTP